MLEETISNFIEQQFPTIYREEGPFFIEFMKQYYVWLETDPTSPIYQARHHVSNHDIDSTVDNFIIYFKEKYLKNIQINTATNTKQLIKNSIDLYRSKGSENAIRLFFDLIFSAESEVYYPGTDVFRLSNAEWVIPQYLEVTSKAVNRLLVGQPIVGVKTGAKAFVERLVRRKIKNNYIEVLYVSAVNGEFATGEQIKFVNPVGEEDYDDYPAIIGSLTTLEVSDGGTDFTKGEVVKLESRTGRQARGLVTSLQSITGIVDFTLENGGWGYTANSNMYVSKEVLRLSNVNITSTTNNSLDNLIVNIVQPMANVQWYANTANFVVGQNVYNYTAGGALIGVNKIISAEYGTNTTTNFFLLNTLSGNNQMDVAAPTYYTAGNTANFTVQNGGWANNTALGTTVGNISSNVVIYCTGNSQNFSVDDVAYQTSSNNNGTFVTCVVKSVTPTLPNTFFMEVKDVEGLFLTNNILISEGTGKNVAITSLSYDIGVRAVTGTFRALGDNRLHDTANTSLWRATLDDVTFGSGANTGFDTNLLYPQTVSINIDYVRDHMAVEPANELDAASYGASLNAANATNMTLAAALNFENKTLGMIARLQNENPGIDYSYAPFVEAVDPLISPMYKRDFVIRYTTTTGVFTIGEELTQTINGAKGLVKFANTSEVHVRRLTFEDRWTVGNSTNAYYMVGTSSGHQAFPTEVTYDIGDVAGHNAVISTRVTSSDSAVATLKVTDSGFGFRDGDDVEFISLDDSHSGTAVGSVVTSGIGSGHYRSGAGFLSSNKYLYDGDYYQDFSYEIKSPISVGRYSDMLKSVLHVAGTKVFSSILKTNLIGVNNSISSSTVGIANTPWIAYKTWLDFTESDYWKSGSQITPLSNMAGYTFTRTGTQGAVDASGAVQWFAPNVPAINDRGYHAYAGLTNYVIRSQEFDNASWQKLFNGAGTIPVVTANAALAPDGTMTADRVQLDRGGSGGADYSVVLQSAIPTAVGAATASIFMRSRTGVSQTVALVTENAGSGTPLGDIFVVGTDWTRVDYAHTSSAANIAIYFGTLGNGFAAGVPNGSTQVLDLDVWLAQDFAGTFPDGGPLIATAGTTAAIGASALTVNDAPASADQLFIARGIQPAPGTINGVLADWSVGGYAQYLTFLFTDDTHLRFLVGGAYDFTSVIPAGSSEITAVLRRMGGNWRGGYIIGGVLTWTTADTAGAFPSTMTRVEVGHENGVNTLKSSVRFVGRKLGTFTTDAQVLTAVAETA